MSRRLLIALAALAFVGWFTLAAANLFFGELNQDEGWYLYAARLVREGLIPFRDFAFTQGPMLPLIYGLAQPLWDGFGVGGGRLLSAILGLVAALSASALAARIAPEGQRNAAAVLAFTLIALNVYQSYFTTVVKTYSLCALFLTHGFLAARIATAKRGAGWYAWAGLVFSAAAATRVTAGLALAVVGLFLFLDRGSRGDRPWIAFGIGGTAGLALFLGSFYVMAPESFRFFMFDYHTHRAVDSIAAALVLKLGMVSRVIQAYFVALSLGAGLIVARSAGIARSAGPRDGLVISAWLTIAGIALVQAAAPFPYDDYQVPLYPLFAALLAAALFRISALGEPRVAGATILLALLVSGASAISSPINKAWLFIGRDRIWWTMKDLPALLQLREAARLVRERSGPESELLTQDTYLAVEAGLRVPRGWEMGVFSYYPDWTRERAERFHVVNHDMLLDQIATSPAQVAAFSDYAFAIAAPAVKPVPEEQRNEIRARVENRFSPTVVLPHFGQGNTTLRIYERTP